METNQESGFSGPSTPVGHSENVLGLTQGSLRTAFPAPFQLYFTARNGLYFQTLGELWISIIRATFKNHKRSYHKPQRFCPGMSYWDGSRHLHTGLLSQAHRWPNRNADPTAPSLYLLTLELQTHFSLCNPGAMSSPPGSLPWTS